MASSFQFSVTCSSPFSCLDGAASVDWHSLHGSTTSLTASIVMFEFPFPCQIQSFSFPKWYILCWSFPTQHIGAVSFFCSQAFFALASISTLLFCYGTNMMVIFSPNSLIKSPSVPSMLDQHFSCIFCPDPLISWHFWLDPQCHCCRIRSNFHCL